MTPPLFNSWYYFVNENWKLCVTWQIFIKKNCEKKRDFPKRKKLKVKAIWVDDGAEWIGITYVRADGTSENQGEGGTVLRFGVKVAVLQIFKCFKNWQKWFQCIVFTSIKCILSKNNQFAIEKFANLSQIHDYLFWFWLFMPLYYWKMLFFSLSFFY